VSFCPGSYPRQRLAAASEPYDDTRSDTYTAMYARLDLEIWSPMMSASGIRRLALLLAVGATGLACGPFVPESHLFAQEPCPRASGVDAEAGWAAYGTGDLDLARARFEAALRRCSDDHYARTGLGYVLLRAGDVAAAARLWSAVVAAEPDNIDALTGLGLTAWRTNDLDAMRQTFARVLSIVPDHRTALEYLGRVTLGPPPDRPPLILPDTLVYPARTNGERFEIRAPDGWAPFYIKGINLGAALPGKHPSEFPDSLTYARWLTKMADANANVVRVYTIHPPAFYQALRDWNERNPQRAIWLVHGVWTELPPDHDFSGRAYEGAFFAEMHDVVDLVHGRADIEPTPGKAGGHYTADVSRWTLAYIIGREWEPFSAIAFDSIRGGRGGFEGRYLTVRGGNAMDAWMARATEEIVAYETETYRAQRPVAYTNWPTLDPLAHPTEATVDEEMAIRRALGEAPRVREREYDNDGLALDAALVEATEELRAGYFASFHAYPYYPDFMIMGEAYQASASSMGRSNYFGYLQELRRHHAGMPVVISEYGVPASLGIGHLQPQGWHHGGLTEAEADEANRRLTLEIAEAGMAGGILFAWIDEWFKRNWVAIEFELPPDRNRLWYNRLDAEQHYGLLALEARPPVAGATLAERRSVWSGIPPLYDTAGLVVRAAHDAAYLWLLIEAPGSAPEDTIFVGFDVVDSQRGGLRWPGAVGDRLPVGVEFVLQATREDVRVVAEPSSNPFRLAEIEVARSGLAVERIEVANPPSGLFHARVEQRFNLPYYTEPNETGRYDSLRVVVNRRRFARDSTEYLAVGYDRGILPRGPAPDGLWGRGEDGALEVRVPWLLLNVTDPSSRTVLQGPGAGNTRDADLGTDGRWHLRPGIAAWPDSIFGELGTRVVDGIGIVASLRSGGRVLSVPSPGAPVARFTWPVWEEPEWVERERPGYRGMAELFARLDPYRFVVPAREALGGAPLAQAMQSDPANEAWLRGDTETALRLYLERLESDPNDGVALHRVALMRAWVGGYDEAHRLFERLLAVEPDNFDAMVDRARVWAWSGQTNRALTAVDAVLTASPGYVPALEARALFEAWAGRYEESLAAYDQLLAILPGNEAARRQQALVRSWASRRDATREMYDSLLVANPADLDARMGLARALAWSDDLEGALEEYDRVLVAAPRHIEALQGRGRTLAWANRLVEAEEVSRGAVALDESNVASLVLLAQILRWQDRNAAALEVLRRAESLAPTDGDVREQLRQVHLALGPVASPVLVWEDDSDGNRMWTTQLAAGVYPTPRLGVRAETYHRWVETGPLRRSAWGATVTASYQLEPGWTVTAGAGGSDSDVPGSDGDLGYRLGLVSPPRHPFVTGLTFESMQLDATAALTEIGVRTTGGVVSARWTPDPRWRVDVAVGRTRFEGTQDNYRTNGFLSVSRRVSRLFTLGASARAFAFEEDLTDGYFDPEFYGIGEVTTRLTRQSGSWSFLLEVAPGLEKVTSSGDPSATLRGSARAAYRLAPGRELLVDGSPKLRERSFRLSLLRARPRGGLGVLSRCFRSHSMKPWGRSFLALLEGCS
jgi:tetratricopeptide (TPR) repeat protein